MYQTYQNQIGSQIESQIGSQIESQIESQVDNDIIKRKIENTIDVVLNDMAKKYGSKSKPGEGHSIFHSRLALLTPIFLYRVSI